MRDKCVYFPFYQMAQEDLVKLYPKYVFKNLRVVSMPSAKDHQEEYTCSKTSWVYYSLQWEITHTMGNNRVYLSKRVLEIIYFRI